MISKGGICWTRGSVQMACQSTWPSFEADDFFLDLRLVIFVSSVNEIERMIHYPTFVTKSLVFDHESHECSNFTNVALC